MAEPSSSGKPAPEASEADQVEPSDPPNEERDDDADKAEDVTKTPFFASYMRILAYGTGNYGWLLMIVALGCAMASGTTLPLMNIIFGDLVGDFNEYFIPGSDTTEDEFKSAVSRSSLFIVYLFIGRFVLTYIAMFSFRMISLKASSALRLQYMQALFAQPVSKLDEISVGTVTNTITALSNTMQQSVSDRLAVLFQAIALLISAYAIAFRYSWALTLVVSSSILFVALGFSATIPILVKGQRNVDLADERHASIAADVFSSIRTVFSLGAEASLSQRYGEWVEEARKRGTRMALVTGIHLALLFFSMYSSFALAFWFGLKLYREGHIPDVGTVITVFFSVLIVVTILGSIAGPTMAIIKAVSASGSFFSVIDSERMSSDGLREPDVSAHTDIVFKNVSFSYPTRADVPVLRGFNARFQQGKTTALVGPSGSGKSTIVALLERWYQLEAPSDEKEEVAMGSIKADSRNLNELDLKWWRRQMGLVQQEPFLFNDTIHNNVVFGLIGSQWEKEPEEVKKNLVVKACEEAFVDEFVRRLPLGYSTVVGEGGITLSGGQRQRLAIARGIVSQPPILILDEATSSIDVRGEKIVQAALERVSKDRTTIMIAHRLSTVRKADHIIVIKDGTNVEEGTHESLLAQEGVYHGLVHAQQLDPLSEATDAIADDKLKSELHDPSAVLEEEEKVQEDTTTEAAKSKEIGIFQSLGVLAREQRAHWWIYSLIMVAAASAGSAYAIQSYLFAKLIEVFQFTGQKLIDAANFWALMFFILALCVAVCYFILGFSSVVTSNFITTFYRKDYFHSILRQSIPFFDEGNNASGSLIGRLSSDLKQLQDLFGPNGVFPLVSIFTVIGCIAVSFSFGWKLAAVAFFAALPFIFLAAFMRIRYELQFENMNAQVYAESSQFAAEAIRAYRTVTSLTMEEHILDRYSRLLAEQRQNSMRKAWYATLIFSFSDSVDFCAMALTFWYGGQLLASREYDMVQFFVVYIAIIQGGQTAGQFFSFGPNIAQAKASANRIFQARKTPGQDPAGTPKDPIASAQFTPTSTDIEFQNVSFNYTTRAVPVFRDLNIKIESGQFVALVGPSGCGKSTVVSLLERFYEPTQGAIIFGGKPIDTIDLASYRSQISLVAQEPKLFNGTIRENLLLGMESTDTASLEERMIQACKDAEIHEFIASLPDGYATELGINAQASLSGGQKQRLCIARALLRRPRLLLLDEATSSLDSQSEKLVQQAMERLAGKHELTIIAVAHRLATIQKADVIFVFGEGGSGMGSRILERGTHAELLRLRGPYWQMCQAQALDR
ncbi:P-loop containing nucleoside triphosphate hydrolase protein [Aspergillus granulosus]|uniref:P-loop containing nucleoside triphosphate hydrolase protein n=1 Tax=Aspergillus granulosus TaxID=176169 RepID=A0ABR4H968_9EURO